MRQHGLWLVGLLVFIAVGAAWLRPSEPEPFRLELVLAGTPKLERGYRLVVEGTPNGAVWTSREAERRQPSSVFEPPTDRFTDGTMSPEQFEAFLAPLEAAGLWTIPDGKAEGKGVLVTRLTVTRGNRTHTSFWVGLPTPDHEKLAQAFLNGPLGKQIEAGMEKIEVLP